MKYTTGKKSQKRCTAGESWRVLTALVLGYGLSVAAEDKLPDRGEPHSSIEQAAPRLLLLAQEDPNPAPSLVEPEAAQFLLQSQPARRKRRARQKRGASSSRAEEMGISDRHVELLDSIHGDDLWPSAGKSISSLSRILEAGAVDTDLGRAEVLRVLLDAYEEQWSSLAGSHWNVDPNNYPREVLVPIFRRAIGPEETRVLDERIHLLLYHGWISKLRGMDKLVVRLIESEHLAPELYEALHAKMLETLRRSCRTSVDQDLAGNPVQIVVSRSKPTDWPSLYRRLFLPLWDSPRATEAHRIALYDALEDAVVGKNRDLRWADTCSVYISWLQARRWITRDHVQRYFDRLFELPAPSPGDRARISYTLFPEVYEACPDWRGLGIKPSRAQLAEWWRGGGREAMWIQPFAKPKLARMFVLVEPDGEGESMVLLTAETAVEAGVVAETSCDSPWGPYRFRVRVMPSPREEGITLSHLAISQEFVDWGIPKELETPYAQHLPKTEHIQAGIYAYIPQFAVLRPAVGYLGGLHVLFVQDADTPPEGVPHDVDSLLTALCRDLPPGVVLHGNFPGPGDEFLPLSTRLALARRYLDLVKGPEHRDEWRRSSSMSNRFARLARFACEHGDDRGREALQKWISRDWPYVKTIKQALQDCEQLLVVAEAADESSYLFDLLDEDDRKPELLALLFNEDVIAGLTDAERIELARLVVERLLRDQSDEALQFRIVVALRSLTGEEFGYAYFGQASVRATALKQWHGWALKQANER